MHQFEEQFYSKVKNTILSWRPDFCKEVCLLALVYGGHDNWTQCQYDFSLTYNTWTHFHQRVAKVGEVEAKWIPAEWTCDYVAEMPNDEDELELWHNWCRFSNIPIDEELTNSPYCDGETIYDVEALAAVGTALCCRIVKRLNSERVIKEKFGAVQPIYIVDAEGWIDKPPTVQANSEELVREFLEVSQDWEA